ncbi:MAG TPA: glycoside hydrolase, partial [Polyangiaceae bacterium]
VVRGTKVWATAWTPPPIWKSTNNKNGSGEGFESNRLEPDHYQDFANYLSDFVGLLAKNGVDLIGLSPANEPDYIASWDGAQWTGDELTTFIGKYLGPTFAKQYPTIKIIAPDTGAMPNCDKYVTPLFADPDAKGYVSVIATHPYSGEGMSYDKPRANNKLFWQTEWSQENMNGDTPDPTMTSAIDMMRHIHDHLTNLNMNSWNWWAIYITADALKDADKPKVRQNPALIQPDKDMDKSYMFKRGWAFGHWSKFVRPGFKRIGATDQAKPGVLIEAYRDDNSHIALTAINTNAEKVTQKFFVKGGSFGKLTPWVTSPDEDLVAKDVKDSGDNFSYDLPAQSVVTFVNWDATKETPNQGTLPVITKPDTGSTTKPQNGILNCSDAMVPSNGGNGGVTDFSDWLSQKWGNSNGLNGYKYTYAGTIQGTTMGADVDATGKFMHVAGTVMSGDYGGAGLSFLSCATVKSFSKVQFSLSGSSPGCDLELQFKTFDQTPTSGNPAGGCPADGSCYAYPTKKQVAVASADVQTVEVLFSDTSNWNDAAAGQVIGLQWQWTTNGTVDSTTGCPIDVKISNIKFLE